MKTSEVVGSHVVTVDEHICQRLKKTNMKPEGDPLQVVGFSSVGCGVWEEGLFWLHPWQELQQVLAVVVVHIRFCTQDFVGAGIT